MTWLSHRIVTGMTVVAVTQNVWFAVASVLGSTFPDRVEQWIPGGWQRHHRRTSHWWPVYLLPLCICIGYYYFYYGTWFWHADEYFRPLILGIWFLIGCLAHILEDAVSGKVPLRNPNTPRAVLPRLFYTGSLSEMGFAIFWMLAMTGWLFARV